MEEQQGCHTIFKSLDLFTSKELDDHKKDMKDYLIEMIEDGLRNYDITKETKYSDYVHKNRCPHCQHCKQTLQDVIWDEMRTSNDDWYNIEKEELQRIQLTQYYTSYIYAFADIGLWDGRRRGHKLMGKEFVEIMSFQSCEYLHVWYDERDGEIYSSTHHHDGTHEIFYREFEIKEIEEGDEYYEYADSQGNVDTSNFEAILYDAKTKEEWMKAINRFTKPVGHYVAKHYGWKEATDVT